MAEFIHKPTQEQKSQPSPVAQRKGHILQDKRPALTPALPQTSSSNALLQLAGLTEMKGMSDAALIAEFDNLKQNWGQMRISPANRIAHALASRARAVEHAHGKAAAAVWWERKREAEQALEHIKTREAPNLEDVGEAELHHVMALRL